MAKLSHEIGRANLIPTAGMKLYFPAHKALSTLSMFLIHNLNIYKQEDKTGLEDASRRKMNKSGMGTGL